jgi:hypothetical protein
MIFTLEQIRKDEERQQNVTTTAARRVRQGEDVSAQYARLNAARDKRGRRRERNLKLAGGVN